VQHWLIKSEPTTFSIDDLASSPKKTTSWTGVRNYQARNFLRAMKKGDALVFYHSSCDPPGAVGLAEVAREAYGDLTALDSEDHGFDPKATEEDPIWSTVDVKHRETFPRVVSLDDLRADEALAGLGLLRKGNRLSVMPVTAAEFDRIRALGRRAVAR
jgi:predicted RNA-binding protein with PUA-like domain